MSGILICALFIFFIFIYSSVGSFFHKISKKIMKGGVLTFIEIVGFIVIMLGAKLSAAYSYIYIEHKFPVLREEVIEDQDEGDYSASDLRSD